jgi:hypothetical protein
MVGEQARHTQAMREGNSVAVAAQVLKQLKG